MQFGDYFSLLTGTSHIALVFHYERAHCIVVLSYMSVHTCMSKSAAVPSKIRGSIQTSGCHIEYVKTHNKNEQTIILENEKIKHVSKQLINATRFKARN